MANTITLEIDVDSKEALQAFEKLQKAGAATSKTLAKGAKQTSQAWSTFKGVLGAQAVVGGFKAIASAAGALFDVVAENTILIETLTTEMTTMTGSAEKAADVMEQLQKFAATTPFQLEGIARSAKQLIAFGFEADKITDKLQAIGDVAAGSGAALGDVSLIFGQVSASGKLTGERMLQFQERAIPIGPALAKTMGIAEESVKDFVSKGKVDFATFEKAFKSLSKEGGIFYKSMIDKSETLAGVISTLKDNFSLFAGELGKKFLPIFKAIAKATISFIQKNKKGLTDNLTGALQKGLTKLLDLLPKVALWIEKAFVTTIESASIALNGFTAVADGVGLAIATISRLAIQTQIGYLKLKGIFADTSKEVQEATIAYEEMGIVQDEFLASIANKSDEVVESVKKIGDTITQTTQGSALSQFVADINKNLLETASAITKVKGAAKASSGGGGGDKQKQFTFSGALSAANAAIEGMITRSGTVMQSVVASIPEWLQSSIGVIGSAVSNAANAMLSTFSSGAEATRTGLDKVKELNESIGGQGDKVKAAQKELLDAKTKEEQKAAKEKLATEKENLKKLSKDREKAEEGIQKTAKDAGVKTLAGAVGGVVGIFSEGAGKFISGIIELAKDPEALVAFVQNLIDNIPAIIDGIVEALPDIIDAIIEALPDIIEAIIEALPQIFETLAAAIPPLIVIFAQGIIKLIAKLPSILFGIIKGLFNGIGKVIGGDFAENFTKIFDKFKEFNKKLIELPTKFVAGILKGAADFIAKLVEQIQGAFKTEGGGKKIGGFLGEVGEGAKGAFKRLGFADGGVIPSGFPNDSFPANLTSGEVVLNKDQQSALGIDINSQQDTLNKILAATQQPIQVNATLQLNDSAFADIILELNKDNRRLA